MSVAVACAEEELAVFEADGEIVEEA